MRKYLFLVALSAIVLAGCNHNHTAETHDEHEGHGFQYTVYSTEFELFAEAEPFIVGKSARVLSHFSSLPLFRALESGRITVRLNVGGNEVVQTLTKPTRKGIYSFDLKPGKTGNGTLVYDIQSGGKSYRLVVPQVTVFATEEAADAAAEKNEVSRTNTATFTKEQSWKVDFSTGQAVSEPFGPIIKSTALVQTNPGDEVVVSAKMSGIIRFTGKTVTEGLDVSAGEVLCQLSGSEMADNNMQVRYAEAVSNFTKSQSDYNRAKELIKDNIVSAKDLASARNQYENARAVYENLNKQFSTGGQKVKSPMAGFVKQLFVKNGGYVEAGQPIVSVAKNKTVLLNAEVQQKYAPLLGAITSANIRIAESGETFSLAELKGKVVSYGKCTNTDNYQIPVTLQVENNGRFVAGSFVDVYLKTTTNSRAMTVPNSALLEDQGVFFLYVQVTPELFEKREVKIGASDGVRTEIVKGLNSEDRIVTQGAILIKLAQATGTLDAHSGHVH